MVQMSDQAQYQEDYFVYSTGVGLASSFPPLAGGETAESTIQIEADSYFKWIKGAFLAYTAVSVDDPSATLTANSAISQQLPPIAIDIIDDSSGRILSNGEIFTDNLFGDGQLPVIQSTPRIFRARSVIRIRARNLETASVVPTQLILNFIGVKGFKV